MIKLANLQQDVKLAPYTTMKVGGPAEWFVAARTREEVAEACRWAAEQGLSVFVLGEGSNVVMSDKPLKRLVLKMEIPGLEVVDEDIDSATIRVGAGEHWDDVVKQAVARGLSGIETMSGIPGTAGAAPVQNAGAYGQEIADTLVELEAFDLQRSEFVTLGRQDCGFRYRQSMFKGRAAGRYVVTSITLKLSKKPPKEPAYESLKRYLEEQGIKHPSLNQIREGVLMVRGRILPDPAVVPNTGSFFESPIVGPDKLEELQREHGQVPAFPYGDEYKIAAGWLLDKCGFKGSEHFGLKIWDKHALVITNPNHAGYKDLMRLVGLIVKTVQDKFGITLETEPQFVE